MLNEEFEHKIEILGQFGIASSPKSIQPFGSGHINDTYLVHASESGEKYLLQRINHHVFRQVPQLMDNTKRVTDHINQKISKEEKYSGFVPISVISTLGNQAYYKDQSGLYWRLMTFVPGSTSYDVASHPAQAFQAGKAFGLFQSMLKDYPASRLAITIPDFHNMESRSRNFENAVADNTVNRVNEVLAEIDFARTRQQGMGEVYALVKNKKLPERVTHNDTKLNNVLFDKTTQEAIAVIDLDTVMPGTVLFDFGDAIRTITNTGAEDEVNLENIRFDLNLFEAFACGYLGEAELLTSIEIDYLPFAGRYMTLIMGLRFLTDFLMADVYYKIKNPSHNLMRAKAQFRLLTCMENAHQAVTEIIEKYARN